MASDAHQASGARGPTLPNCPTKDRLLAFHRGTLPEADVEAVAEHLEACATCEAALAQMDGAADPLLAVLRQPLPATAPVRRGDDEGDPTSAENWPRLPDYQVVCCLGRGGMGVVYRARQVALNRPVALKRLRPADERDVARARAEAEARARLQHPNIVQIYEVFRHEGATYLALELVEGGSLAARLQGKPQPPRATAELIEPVARAVHFAHGHGIVHRDLKPANILLQAHGLQPVGLAVPKISDFGIAKHLFADAGTTQEGEVIGTPAYMAPEQAAGQLDAVGPATDVYSLGVILYEMLTGRVPLQGPTTLGTLLLVRTQEPVPPRRLQPQVPRDLETICLKCLEKEPARRYASAAELADDLRRFLAGEAVRARPTPAWERGWKWARRRPLVAALSAGIVLVAALGFALVAWQWRRAEHEAARENVARQEAQDKQRQTEVLSAGITLSQGTALCEAGDVSRGLLWLARGLDLAERAGDADLGRAARANLAAWSALVPRPRAQFPHDGWVWAAAFSPDGRTVLTGSADHTARLWDAATGRPRGEPLRHDYPVWAVAFSPDGRTVLTGGGDDEHNTGGARLWDAATGRPLGPPVPDTGEVGAVAFSPDGQTFLTVGPRQARLWRTADGRPLGPPLPHPKLAHTDALLQPRLSGAFSPDGTLVATGGEDGTARLWDAATGSPRGERLRATGPVLALAFSPDGRTLLTGSLDGAAQMWDVAGGRPRGPALRHRGAVRAVAFSADGRLIATGGSVREVDPETGEFRRRGGEVRLWDARTGRSLGEALPHPAPVWSLAFSPDGRLLLTGCEDAGARFFLVATGAPAGGPILHEGTVTAVAFNRGGTAALTTSAGGFRRAAARLSVPPPEQGLPRLLLQRGELFHLAFSPDGKQLLSNADDRTVRQWGVAGREVGPGLRGEKPVMALAFGPDGRTLFTADQDGQVRVWDGATHRLLREFGTAPGVTGAAFSPDGRAVLIGRGREGLGLWETTGGQAVGPPLTYAGYIESVAFSPDGRTLVAAGDAGIRLWDRETRELVRAWSGSGVTQVAFYPGGKKLLLAAGGSALDWDIETGHPLGPAAWHPLGGVDRVTLSPDGRSALVSDSTRVARLWDVATGRAIGPAPCPRGSRPVAFSPDGRLMAVGDWDGRIAVWETPAPLEGNPEQVRLAVEVLTGLELDARSASRSLDRQELKERRDRLEELGGPPAALRRTAY